MKIVGMLLKPLDKGGAVANKFFTSPRMGRVEHIHFVGIGGVGMCGIAIVLHNDGYKITGSDQNLNKNVEYLSSLGIKVIIGHAPCNIVNADVVVKSTAVSIDNPEIQAALTKLIPVIPRAKMLAELMRFKHGIAVAGTHGKTTTTSLISSLLGEGGLDPSFVIGGKLNSCGTNGQLGKSSYFVAEADESDASFLFLKPMTAVVTNIDLDHMETYDDSFDKLTNTFLEFLHHLPFYGLAVVCLDDPQIAKILAKIQRPTLTYGFMPKAHYRAINWHQQGLISYFEVVRPKHDNLKLKFACPGKHNVLNSLAAICVATELGVSDKAIIQGMASFAGVGRRFQVLGNKKFSSGSATIVDDYGHHPKEISSTIEALRQVWPDKKLIHIFQPHRYSRTKSLYKQLIKALSLSDELILMNIFSAGERALAGISSENMAKDITTPVHLLQNQDITTVLNNIIKQDNNIILMQGAGSISSMAKEFSLEVIS